MNKTLIEPVRKWVAQGLQVVWQTGDASLTEMRSALSGSSNVFMYNSLPDLYPYYAVARIVIARSGAGTLAECALFGVPAIFIPLPWAAENHQWMNAGVAQDQGWAIRIRQDETCGHKIFDTATRLLNDPIGYKRMHEAALAHASVTSAGDIARTIALEVRV